MAQRKVVGFTGTQDGMTEPQLTMTTFVLGKLHVMTDAEWVDHGDCVGSDAQAHKIAKKIGYKVGIHPPINESKRAFCEGADKMFEPDKYILRNHSIVDLCQVLLATPKGPETLRSGTWATVRYALRRMKPRPVYVVMPEGIVYSAAWGSVTKRVQLTARPEFLLLTTVDTTLS